MHLTPREIAAICTALAATKRNRRPKKQRKRAERLTAEAPLSSAEIEALRRRLLRLAEVNGLSPRVAAPNDVCEFHLKVPTYLGSKNATNQPPNAPDFGPPYVTVKITEADGVKLSFGSADPRTPLNADLQLERRPNGWSLFLHPDAGDPAACVFLLDTGKTFLLPERFIDDPIEIVHEIPPELDV